MIQFGVTKPVESEDLIAEVDRSLMELRKAIRLDRIVSALGYLL